jgi:NADH:ubiquinone oxidoreductase subunit 6 (subunit J)
MGGLLPFAAQEDVAFFGIKLYIDFFFCFIYFGFLLFMVLVGVSQIAERE